MYDTIQTYLKIEERANLLIALRLCWFNFDALRYPLYWREALQIRLGLFQIQRNYLDETSKLKQFFLFIIILNLVISRFTS